MKRVCHWHNPYTHKHLCGKEKGQDTCSSKKERVTCPNCLTAALELAKKKEEEFNEEE